MVKRIILGILAVFLVVILIIAGLILVPSIFSSQTSYDESTTLSILSGDVFVMEGDSDSWDEAKDGMDLAAEDSVKTGADSYALITFFEGTTMNIEPDTEISISELTVNEETDSTIVRLKQKAGETWNRVEKLADSASKYEIETSAGVGAVRGTTIGLVVGSDGKTTMKVYEGEGSLFAQGVPVIIGEGMESSAQPGQPPTEASTIPLPDSVLRLSVSPSAWMNSVDSAGRSAGMVPPGIVVNQIPGAITSGYGYNPQFIEIPNPKDGTYNVVLYGNDSGQINLSVEGLLRNGSSFTSIFKEQRVQETNEEDKWRIDLQAVVVNGVLSDIVLPAQIEPLEGDEPGSVTVTQGAFDGRIDELANSFDEKYDAFKENVYSAMSGEEVVLIFTEDEVAGKIAKWANGPDSPVDFYNIKIELNSTGIGEGSGKFDYSIFTGKLDVKVRVDISDDKRPKVVVTSIGVDLGALPLPVSSFKSRINEEAENATWNLPADLISVDMGDDQIVLTVIKR
ncbi:MAG: FecR domain-containing protein [Chloroflexi bacterium]|nr:FecR domain-containing protein [Chloroflexota bacterium]